MLDSEITEERDVAMTNIFPSLRVQMPARVALTGHDQVIRILDVTIALIALVVFAPLMLLVAALVKLGDGGPAVFSHQRIGAGGRRFGCLKFRSMVTDADE